MKTAVITGASSDMAVALQSLLDKDGWRVVGLHRTDMDLAKLDSVIAGSEKLARDLERVDAIVHFAGIWHDDKKALAGMKLEAFSPEEIADSMNVALTSFMIMVSKLLPKMSDGASIIGITGTYEDGGAGWLPYYVSKRGLEDFLVGLSQEAPQLNVFGISPSDTNTKPYQKFYPEYAAEGQSPQVVAQLAYDLMHSRTDYHSGDIVKIKQGERSKGYHV